MQSLKKIHAWAQINVPLSKIQNFKIKSLNLKYAIHVNRGSAWVLMFY